MYSFDYDYRIRYADIDQMGYMYYGNYAKLYEIGAGTSEIRRMLIGRELFAETM